MLRHLNNTSHHAVGADGRTVARQPGFLPLVQYPRMVPLRRIAADDSGFYGWQSQVCFQIGKKLKPAKLLDLLFVTGNRATILLNLLLHCSVFFTSAPEIDVVTPNVRNG